MDTSNETEDEFNKNIQDKVEGLPPHQVNEINSNCNVIENCDPRNNTAELAIKTTNINVCDPKECKMPTSDTTNSEKRMGGLLELEINPIPQTPDSDSSLCKHPNLNLQIDENDKGSSDICCNEFLENTNLELSENHVSDDEQLVTNYFGIAVGGSPLQLSPKSTNNYITEEQVSDNKEGIPNANEMVTEETSSDNSVVISNSNAVPQSESIVSSNYSLAQLRDYDSDESLNEETGTVSMMYREPNNEIISLSDSDTSSSSSSTSICASDSSDFESDCEIELGPQKAKKVIPIKAKGEFDLCDLPPIEDLTISVPEEKCKPIGQVFQIVGTQVVVQSFKDRPALNLDSVLFLQGGKPLGKIFDVFGPVAEPYYSVRFNSIKQIEEKEISINQVIYCAPQTEYTSYIFLSQLMKLKGSDASWEYDLEPPPECLDYSDDEQEQQAKKTAKAAKSKNSVKGAHPSDPDEPAKKKHSSYEKKMNKLNLQLTAARKLSDENQRLADQFWGKNTAPSSSGACTIRPVKHHSSNQMFGRPPVFSARANVGYMSPDPNLFPPRPSMFHPRCDIYSLRPKMIPSNPDIHSPRPPLSTPIHPPPHSYEPPPPRPNMFPPQPDMFSPPPNIYHQHPDMFPPNSPNMFPQRLSRPSSTVNTFQQSAIAVCPPIQPPSSNHFPQSPNPVRHPFYSVTQPSPPRHPNQSNSPHFPSYTPSRIPPVDSPRPFSSFLPPGYLDNSNQERQTYSYQHFQRFPRGDTWGPQPSSFGWPSSQPDRPLRPPPPNPM